MAQSSRDRPLLVFLFSYLITTSSAAASEHQKWVLFHIGGDNGVVQFFDSAGMKTLSDGHLAIWVKSIPRKKLQIFDKQAPKMGVNQMYDDAVAKAAVRLLTESRMSIERVLTVKINKEARAEMMLFEALADGGSIEAKYKIFFEIDCRNDLMRSLSTFLTGPEGEVSSSEMPSQWLHVPPETAGSNLVALTCAR